MRMNKESIQAKIIENNRKIEIIDENIEDLEDKIHSLLLEQDPRDRFVTSLRAVRERKQGYKSFVIQSKKVALESLKAEHKYLSQETRNLREELNNMEEKEG